MPITLSTTTAQLSESDPSKVVSQNAPEPEKEKRQPQQQPHTEKEQQHDGSEEYITGGDNPATRPEQGEDVPPEEQTIGIP